MSCKPGEHDFVWDEEENKNRIDGGSYHKCTKCRDLARSSDSHESFRQVTHRIESESRKMFKEGLKRIR